ncbi:MAG: zinc protease [Frankiales bacterium]|nr:zinc protease [Frankiales bacterium]
MPLSYAIERATLANGLKVVLLPDRTSPVIALAVYYDVGMRSEPEGRTGFAHLFEHLMFQGSANVGKTEHFTHVQGAGGYLNGTTHIDYTNYYEVLPSSATELALFLEADRMRSIALSQDNLDNQVAVVQNEIRVNVHNRPYGGFPWLSIPPLLYDTFANSHDGYGSFVDLEAATLKDARSFFDRYYAPGNAVLSIAGDLDVPQTMRWIEQHFGDIPGRKTPKRPRFSEPPLTHEKRATTTDALAPTPATAIAWRTPDPANLERFLPFVVLAEVLTDGDAARLQQRLLLKDRIATSVGGYLGLLGDPLDARDPTPLVLEIHHAGDADLVVDTVAEEIDRLATDGLGNDEVQRTVARIVSRYLRGLDPVLGRATNAAVFEQQRGRPDLLNQLPALLEAVTADQIKKAAATLRPDNRAVLELRPA